MKYFDQTGRRIPTDEMRVFGNNPRYYYKIQQPIINYSSIFDKLIRHNNLSRKITLNDFEKRANILLEKFYENKCYSNLLKGVHIPFVIEDSFEHGDLGSDLEKRLLPNLQKAFNEQYPDRHFKAILQSNSKLPGNIKIDPDSRYELLIKACKQGPIIGWYFPQALQEFDISSQRRQMRELPDLDGIKICLSGGADICSALIGTPELLINEIDYTPILCMSAYVHADPRLILLVKSYGPHMEFWCMTQMLTKDITQVSEQWSGGLTIFG